MIECDHIGVAIGDLQLSNLSLKISKGEYAILQGRTGSGKTSLLEVICGLRSANAGTVRLDGVEVTTASPAARDIGFVPQEAALFPTKTVASHLAFGPRVRGWARDAIAERTSEIAEALGIESLLHRRPRGLSGGERQRVALGRALAARPSFLCLDEPLSALDAETRLRVSDWLRREAAENAITTLHVSHDRAESDGSMDRLFRLQDGILERLC